MSLTKFELEGMAHGAFPMDKDEGVAACRAYRAGLEAQGLRTYLDWLFGGIYVVKVVSPGVCGDEEVLL